MSFPLTLHILAAGLWLGCVFVEVFFERALASGSDRRILLATLHWNVDLYVELPALLIVAATGALLLRGATVTPALHAMIGFGVIAMLANIHCAWAVMVRRRHALAGNTAEYERADHLQHKVGAVVLIGLLLAMLAGFWNMA